MDRKLQYELAKLAGAENEKNNYYTEPSNPDRSFYDLPKDENGWVDGNVLLQSVKPMPIIPQHKLETVMQTRPIDNKLCYQKY